MNNMTRSIWKHPMKRVTYFKRGGLAIEMSPHVVTILHIMNHIMS